jgi:hypothetical protein
VDQATAAAYTAAALSLVSVVVGVVLSYRLSSRGQLEQWRRDAERPIVARLLTLSNDALDNWLNGYHARMDWITSRADPGQSSEDIKAREMMLEQWQAGAKQYGKIEFEVAQLTLIAGFPLREAATALSRLHWTVVRAMPPLADMSDWFERVAEQMDRIAALHDDLATEARADLGVDPRSEPRWQSLWRRLRARRKLTKVKAAYPAFLIESSARPRGFVAVERSTGKRAVLAATIEGLERLLIDRQLADERGEPRSFVQEI